jgi:hypothetical protein
MSSTSDAGRVDVTAAQWRLEQALGDLYGAPGQDIGQATDPLAAFIEGVAFARALAEGEGLEVLADVYRAFEALGMAVREGLLEQGVRHG